MSEPLLSEDTDLERLVASIRAEHGDAATFMYHDSVRRGGVLGFFAREVHRVAYQVTDDPDGTAGSDGSEQQNRASAEETGGGWPQLSTWAEADSWSTTTGDDPSLATYNATAADLEAAHAQRERESWGRDYEQLRDINGPISLAPPVPTHAAAPAYDLTPPDLTRPDLGLSNLNAADVNGPSIATAEQAALLYSQDPAQPSGAHRAGAVLPTSPIFELLAEAEEAETHAHHSHNAETAREPAAFDFAQVLQNTIAETTPDDPASDVTSQGQDEDGWQQFLQEMGTDPNESPSPALESPSDAWTSPIAPTNPPPLLNNLTSVLDSTTLGDLSSANGPDPVATVTQMANSPARARLDILMQLREVGVPVGINPRSETHNIYQAMEDVLSELPPAPALPGGAGDVIALVGELTPALRTATAIAQQLRVPVSAIWIAGLEGHPAQTLLGDGRHQLITGAPHALELQTELRSADVPAIVVVVTDSVEATPEDPWAAQLLAGLAPTVTWLMVDATGKPEDERAKLDRLGGPGVVGALAVHSARVSASPATTWDLGLPIALLDGRPASTFTWASLLFGALHTGARHLATA